MGDSTGNVYCLFVSEDSASEKRMEGYKGTCRDYPVAHYEQVYSLTCAALAEA